LRREKRGSEWRRPARIAITGALAYIGLNAAISEIATLRYWDGPGAQLMANPVPLIFWEREVISTGRNWPSDWPGAANEWKLVPFSVSANKPLVDPSLRCRMPDTQTLRQSRPDLDAFLFWSRAPYAMRAPDGSVLIGDARFVGELSRGRFTVALPEVRCEEPVAE
jgi:inner membrane protein